MAERDTWMHLRRSRAESFDDAFYHGLIEEVHKAIGAEATQEQVRDLAVAVTGPMIDTMASRLVARLMKLQPRMIRTHRRYTRGFERRLRRYWGDALDRFYAILICAHEMGSDFNDSHRQAAVDTNDLVFEALSGLHARACRTASEVHHLLSSGFPMGALARCRTLHELTVTAGVISEYGRKPEYSDLAERYLLHDAVLNWKDAIDYQEHCEALGCEPFTDAEIDEMKATRDAVVGRFGTPFGEANGWASKLATKRRVDFRDLEKLADLSHLRGYYKWASHEVHADSKGWRLNRAERGKIEYMSSGHVNFGFSEPGQLALNSLVLCTDLFLMCTSPVTPEIVVSMQAIQGLLENAANSFAHAEQMVDEAEEKFQRRVKPSKASN
jgi:hypothetical protein